MTREMGCRAHLSVAARWVDSGGGFAMKDMRQWGADEDEDEAEEKVADVGKRH